ncbi:MAG: 16S rRNA (uracil(1498)-N(3))-methyltransferase [Candidatus Omnitrophica bacterium]|nr:16S rRNA (uracil(1498)-N(3))-methyltransferase [Candidatus Omnitrophota bacterium]MDD5310336.1 16S rRNA (uracil(1498)-N(3))-methyltransferase [Candidatus Omnitrophota bacterium]MDD5545881.1 16S rRNA (uracil(1498)-N(3))-methyltransferase [Candidatus Omnitrophota bacterium]
MSRFYVPPECVAGGKIIIRGDELHHARDVMRLAAGDGIAVFDGTGKEYHGVILDVDKEQMTVAVEKTVERKDEGCRLILVQALPKSDKMDLIIEKATELGAAKIIPVTTGRTVVRSDAKKENSKTERWRKIALVAAKQCGRTTIPEVMPVTGFGDALKILNDAEIKIIPCLSGNTKALKEVLGGRKVRSAAVLIGPEGDFTDKEINDAKTAGAVPVSLGPEVLRSETAAICALSVLNYELRW